MNDYLGISGSEEYDPVVGAAIRDLRKMKAGLYKEGALMPGYSRLAGIEGPGIRDVTLGEVDWSDVTDVELRIDEAGLKYSHDFEIFPKDEMDVYFASIVTDDIEPQVTPFLDLFENARRGEKLPLNHPCLYRNADSGDIPRFIDYRVSMIRSKDKTRKAGEVMQDILGDPQYQEISAMLSTVQPPTSAVITLATNVTLGIISKYLGTKKDDQLLTTAGSLSKKIDNLGLGLTFDTQTEHAWLKMSVEAA